MVCHLLASPFTLRITQHNTGEAQQLAPTLLHVTAALGRPQWPISLQLNTPAINTAATTPAINTTTATTLQYPQTVKQARLVTEMAYR